MNCRFRVPAPMSPASAITIQQCSVDGRESCFWCFADWCLIRANLFHDTQVIYFTLLLYQIIGTWASWAISSLSHLRLIVVYIYLFWAAVLLSSCIILFWWTYWAMFIDPSNNVLHIIWYFGAHCWAAYIRLYVWLLLIWFHIMMHQGCIAFFYMPCQTFVLKL